MEGNKKAIIRNTEVLIILYEVTVKSLNFTF